MARGIAAKLISERSKRLHQGQNSSSTPGSPGRPIKRHPNAEERAILEKKRRETGYTA